MGSGAKFRLPRILAHRCGLSTMWITIERWNWYRHFVKGIPQILLKVKPGVAVAEKRTKANLQNVGVAAKHILLVRKAIGLLFSPHNNRLQLTAGMVSDRLSLCFSLRPAAAEPERYADFFLWLLTSVT